MGRRFLKKLTLKAFVSAHVSFVPIADILGP